MMARKRAKGLSERQIKILEVLERFNTQNGYPPSIREICDMTSISSTSVVNYYLDQLEKMGGFGKPLAQVVVFGKITGGGPLSQPDQLQEPLPGSPAFK